MFPGGGPLARAAGHCYPSSETSLLLAIYRAEMTVMTPAGWMIGLMPPTPLLSSDVGPNNIYIFYDNCFNNTAMCLAWIF